MISVCCKIIFTPIFSKYLSNHLIFIYRRLHQGNTTWHGTTTMPVVQGVQTKQNPDRLKGTTCDLFELLEKAQSSRLDDQRCVLPAYFNQVKTFIAQFN